MFAPPPVRRSKDRAALSGGKVTATARSSKPLTPVSVKSTLEPALKRSSSAKENPGSASRVPAATRKPTVPQIARFDKGSAAAEIGNDRVRLRTSSVPRGRSSSPSEFIRVFNDRGSRVSVDKGSERNRVVSSGVKSGSLKRNGLMELNGKENVKFGVNLEKKGTLKKMDLGIGGSRVLGSGVRRGGANLSSHLLESCKIDANGGLRSCSDEGRPEMDHKTLKKVDLGNRGSESKFCGSRVLRSGVRSGGGAHLNSQLLESCIVDGNGGLGSCIDVCRDGMDCKEDVCKEESSAVSTLVDGDGDGDSGLKGASGLSGGIHGNKYPSRLHEKLAFLEGKVKRIASDIKRTKEMLDLNNPDASKMILSDIQEKISGIEKVVGNDNCDSDGKAKSTKGAEICDHETQKALPNLVKGLNGEELEARFFPHHKLLRNRTSSKASSCTSQIHEPVVDDEPIALEFLASLDREQSKVTTRNGHADIICYDVQEVDDAAATSSASLDRSKVASGRDSTELSLTADETLGEFDDQENKPAKIVSEEIEYANACHLNDIGCKTSTGGWFVSDGDAVLLAHDDNSCSFYDIANSEVKTEYKPPSGISSNLWRDCWIIRAPSSDGCSGRYVVAASAGNTMDSGFCSWDFYSKDVQAFHVEDGTVPMDSRTILGPLPSDTRYRRNASSNVTVPQQWWYKPSGPLIVSTASGQKSVRVFDIRDGEHIMKWDLQKPVSSMDYSSPLQWRNRGKVVVAEAETISIWDVNSLTPEPLLSVPLAGQKISALHVINTDAELGGGVRQRVSSLDAEGHDGVFCTDDSINILDFRHPTGVGIKIPKLNVTAQSIFSRGDSVFLGCANTKSGGKKQQRSQSQVQQFSLRQQKLFTTYDMPETNAHSSYTAITQVYGNSNLVMAACGLGLFVFDALKDDALQSFMPSSNNSLEVREVIGPDDLYSPSFDYLGSRALLISGDRPAMWKYLS